MGRRRWGLASYQADAGVDATKEFRDWWFDVMTNVKLTQVDLHQCSRDDILHVFQPLITSDLWQTITLEPWRTFSEFASLMSSLHGLASDS